MFVSDEDGIQKTNKNLKICKQFTVNSVTTDEGQLVFHVSKSNISFGKGCVRKTDGTLITISVIIIDICDIVYQNL